MYSIRLTIRMCKVNVNENLTPLRVQLINYLFPGEMLLCSAISNQLYLLIHSKL